MPIKTMTMKKVSSKQKVEKMETLDQIISWTLEKGDPTVGLYCTQHLASILNVSPKTVNSWKSRGLLPALKINNMNFFWEDDVVVFLQIHLIKRTNFQNLKNSINYN
jgi:hypothetical protein